MAIKLYGRPTSARTQKVMLALAELGLEYDYVLASATMGPEGSVAKGGTPFGVVHTQKYYDINPTRTIPTLDDNGYILWESNAIVQYLGMRYNSRLFYSDLLGFNLILLTPDDPLPTKTLTSLTSNLIALPNLVANNTLFRDLN